MGQEGFEGTPLPQSLMSDDILTLFLLGCIVLTLLVVKRSRKELVKEFKRFTYQQSNERGIKTYGLIEMIILNVQTCFLVGLVFALYLKENTQNGLTTQAFYIQMATISTIAIAYILMKHLLYALVNSVFFAGNKNGQWFRSFLFLNSLEGFLILPSLIPCYLTYISARTMAVYALFVIIFCKISAFYRLYSIFFRQKIASLQIFLYFCALEIVPLLVLGIVLKLTTNDLKVFF